MQIVKYIHLFYFPLFWVTLYIMRSPDWSKVYEEYKGLWVVLFDDNETVVGSGKTTKDALEQAHRSGFPNAAITCVPKEYLPSSIDDVEIRRPAH